jgi:hypothetical protein
MGPIGEKMVEEAYQLYCKENKNAMTFEEFVLSDKLNEYFEKIKMHP